MYKTQAEVEAALSETYSGPIYQREGDRGQMFDYIPWTETVRLLNKMFGPFGWDTTEPVVTHTTLNNGGKAVGVYTVSLALTVRGMTEDGLGFSKTVPGVGQAKDYGDDNAAKSALSDAISRAAKLLGDAFGFALYEKKPQQRTTTTTPRVTHGDLGRRPSEKQTAMLVKNGIAYETMTYDEWHDALDKVFEKLNAKREAQEATF